MSGFTVVAKLIEEKRWQCSVCGALVPWQDWAAEAAVLNHLWKQHRIASAQVGYTWIGYPNDTKNQS